jgi:hypothetical protein
MTKELWLGCEDKRDLILQLIQDIKDLKRENIALKKKIVILSGGLESKREVKNGHS